MKKQLEVLYVSSKKVQKAISKPIPKKIIDCFYSTPLTASEIAEAVSFPKDKIYYHIKKLISLDILFVSETEEVKGIVQKKFLPISSKIVFGKALDTDKSIDLQKDSIGNKDLSKKVSIEKTIVEEVKIPQVKKTKVSINRPLPPKKLTNDSSNRIISDRRKSRNRRTSFQRRSKFDRRIKQSFEYSGPERRVLGLRRNIDDRRIIYSRRIKNDRRLESDFNVVQRSIKKTTSVKAEKFISNSILFSSLAHLQGMKKAITFVQSGDTVTFMQAEMGLDDFIVKDVRNYSLPMRIDDHIIYTLPELIRHVYYQTVNISNSRDYYLGISSSDYDYQMVYLDTEKLETDIETHIKNNIEKSFDIQYDKTIVDWTLNDSFENSAVVCYSTKIDSIRNDYKALTNFGIQPRYNTSMPQVIYNIYRYSHFGIGGGNTLIIYIDNNKTNLVLIQNAQLVDSHFFTIGFGSFINVIIHFFNDTNLFPEGSKLSATKFLQDCGVIAPTKIKNGDMLETGKMKKAYEELHPIIESFKSEIISSFNFFTGVRNKISGRGLIIDNIFIGGSGSHIRNMKDIIQELLNYSVHSLDDLYLGHTKKLTLPKQQKKLARNQKNLLKRQRSLGQDILKIKSKLELNESELNVYSDLSRLEKERDQLIMDKAQNVKSLEKTQESLLLAKMEKTKLDDNFKNEKKRLVTDLEKMSDDLDSVEKENLDRYKKADQISQHIKNSSKKDKSRLVNEQQSVTDIEILIRDIQNEKIDIEKKINSLESDISIISSKIIQQEKAIELNVKEHLNISSELEEKKREADHFFNNPWRRPKTTMDLRGVLTKDNNDLSLRMKELDISLVTKKSDLEKYNEKRRELIKTLSPINTEHNETLSRYDDYKSRFINISLEYEKNINSLNIIEGDYEKTNLIYLENLSELDGVIKRLDKEAIENEIKENRANLIEYKKQYESSLQKLASMNNQFDLDISYDKAEQKNLIKKRVLAEKSFASAQRRSGSAKTKLEKNILDIDNGKKELRVLTYLENAIKTTHDLMELKFSDDLMVLNNSDRSIETALSTSEKSISWSLSHLGSNREKFASQNFSLLQLKKRRSQHEKNEISFVKNVLSVMDVLLNTPKDLSMLKDSLQSLKVTSDGKANFLNKLNDNELASDDNQQKKSFLIKEKSNNERLATRNEKIVKKNENVLKNKQLELQDISSIISDKNKELDTLQLLNARDIESNDEVISSRASAIDKYEIDIAQLQINKKDKIDLKSEKRIQESNLVDTVKKTEVQLKQIALLDRTLAESENENLKKIGDFEKISQDIEKDINQLYNDISSEEEWIKKSKARVKEIQNEKLAWKEETIILRDEEKSLDREVSNLKRETLSQKRNLQNDFSANIEKIEIEQAGIIKKSNDKKEKVKKELFVELDILQKQEEGIQAQLDKEVVKLDAISNKYQMIKDQIKKEEERIYSDNLAMTKQTNEYEYSRDDIQSDIYKLQNDLRMIKSKKEGLEGQLSDRVITSAEKILHLEERLIYKKTDDHLSFVIEGLERVGTGTDQTNIAQQIISESIELDIKEVKSLKDSLKNFKKSTKEKLAKFILDIKNIEKELSPYQKKRNTLTRKIRALNRKNETLNKPINKLRSDYEKISNQIKIAEKNFLVFQSKAESDLKNLSHDRGEREDEVTKEIATIDDSFNSAMKKIEIRIKDSKGAYKIGINQADDKLSDILSKVNNRKEKIKIIISAGKKIQEENNSESLSIMSRRKTSVQLIKKYKNNIKAKRIDLAKNEKSKIIDLEKYEKYERKILKKLNQSDDRLIKLNSEKEKLEERLVIINTKIARYDELNPNIDNDIDVLNNQIKDVKGKINLGLKIQSDLNKKFLNNKSKIVFDLESLNKEELIIVETISTINTLLSNKKDELVVLYGEIKKINNNINELDLNYKILVDEKIDFSSQFDILEKDENRIKSVISRAISEIKYNIETRKNILPLLKNRIEEISGFLKEYNADQKVIKDSIKQLIINQKTKAISLVSVEQDISSLRKKIDSAEIYFQNNKKVIEDDLTQKKILIDRSQSDIIGLEDRLESVMLQLKTLFEQKTMTERAIKASDKEFKKNIIDQQNICGGIKKEKDEINNTLLVIKASVSDLEARKKPLDIEKRKINDWVENLQIEIEQIGNDLKNSTVHFNDNERNLKKADKIISSEHQKLRDEEIDIKESIRSLELKLENSNNYNKDMRRHLENSIKKKIDLEDILSNKDEIKQNIKNKLHRTESLIVDQKKLFKLKEEEKKLTKEINIAENKVSHLRENFKSINEVLLDTEHTYNSALKPLNSKISAAELAVVDARTMIRDTDRRILELNRRIRIAPTKAKKLDVLHRKYMKLKDEYDLQMKEADRGLHLIKKKIKILEKQQNDKENKDYEITKDIDYIANIGLLLNPKETLNLLPDQHKKDYWFYMPNRLLQAGVILFIFLSTIINVFQTSSLNIKEDTISDKIKNYSVVKSEKTVYDDLLNDINILDHYKNKMTIDEINSKNIIALLKYISNAVPKEFKVTELTVNEPGHLNSVADADASISIYVGGFVKMNSSRSKKILNSFQEKVEMNQYFKEVKINEQVGGKNNKTIYGINLLL